jgi:Fe-S cluster biogenesis protein NfuA
MATVPDPQVFREKMERLETLIQEVERFPDPAAREHTRDIVQAVLDLHGTGLERILEHLAAVGETGQTVVEALVQDDVVSGLLLLYGLHPLGMEERVRQAVDRLVPTLRKQGGEVEILGITGGLVRLRLQLTGHSCGSSAGTLRRTVEDAIYARAPEVTAVEVDGLPEPASGPSTTFVPVEQLIGSISDNQRRENSHGTTSGRNASPAGTRAGHLQG